jgi:hypothetical protein
MKLMNYNKKPNIYVWFKIARDLFMMGLRSGLFISHVKKITSKIKNFMKGLSSLDFFLKKNVMFAKQKKE